MSPGPASTLADHVKHAKQQMTKSVEAVKREFSTVRTGKATTALLDLVRVVRRLVIGLGIFLDIGVDVSKHLANLIIHGFGKGSNRGIVLKPSVTRASGLPPPRFLKGPDDVEQLGTGVPDRGPEFPRRVELAQVHVRGDDVLPVVFRVPQVFPARSPCLRSAGENLVQLRPDEVRVQHIRRVLDCPSGENRVEEAPARVRGRGDRGNHVRTLKRERLRKFWKEHVIADEKTDLP